ncbi:MAG: DedA family protein [Cyanobacteria bacterium J06649_4]
MDIAEQVTNAITTFGYWGIAFLMLLENVIPPIPSELIMPLAGFAAARGEMNMVSAIIAGTIGSVLGGTVWYYIGQLLGLERICKLSDRYGKWFGISSKEVLATQDWFSQRGGYLAIGFGRLVPGIRTYISVPAGIANMPLVSFLVVSTIGSLAWTAFLTLAGYWLGDRYEQVAIFLAPISKFVITGLIILVISRFLYQAMNKVRKSNHG